MYAAYTVEQGYCLELAEPDSPWWQELRVLLKYKQHVDETHFDAWILDSPIFGTNFSYPFSVKSIATGRGTITLTGNFSVAGSPPVTLNAAVPSGNQTFKYTVNGKTFTNAGTGAVTVQ